MGDENNPFTDEELIRMNKDFQKKREFFKEHPEQAMECTEKRIKKDNEGFLEFLKKYETPNNDDNSFDVEPVYNRSKDVLCMTVDKDYEPAISIKLDSNIFLDFDEDRNPIALRIMNASKTFDIVKDGFRKRNILAFRMGIHINFKSITVNASFLFYARNKEEKIQISPNIANSLRLPTINTEAGLSVA